VKDLDEAADVLAPVLALGAFQVKQVYEFQIEGEPVFVADDVIGVQVAVVFLAQVDFLDAFRQCVKQAEYQNTGQFTEYVSTCQRSPFLKTYPLFYGSLEDAISCMDIIGNGDFAVTNFQGKTTFSFRAPSMEKMDFVHRVKSPATPFVSSGPKVGANDPCPCGSGKKFKKL